MIQKTDFFWTGRCGQCRQVTYAYGPVICANVSFCVRILRGESRKPIPCPTCTTSNLGRGSVMPRVVFMTLEDPKNLVESEKLPNR